MHDISNSVHQELRIHTGALDVDPDNSFFVRAWLLARSERPGTHRAAGDAWPLGATGITI